MHGIIHAELKKYVETKHSRDAWTAILEQAGLEKKTYLATSAYPDEEAVAIVTTASQLTGTPADQMLEDFGEFIVPSLMNLYKALVKPEWGTMEMLLSTENTVHRVVRMRNPGAEPPELRFEQTDTKELKFFYNSPRQMSAVAKGIIKGVAKHYGDTVVIRERKNADGSVEMSIKIQ